MPLIQPLDYLIELCELLTGQHGETVFKKFCISASLICPDCLAFINSPISSSGVLSE